MSGSVKLVLLGMVSGFSLPEATNEIVLDSGRIFRNPAAFRQPGSPPEMGPNTAIYTGEDRDRHLIGEVATYLIETKIDVAKGQLGHTNIHGSGGVMIGISSSSEGVTLSTGEIPHSGARIAVPVGQAWNTPSLVLDSFQKMVLPLRLMTKGRILVFPVGVLANDRRQDLLNTGLNTRCPVLIGTGLEVKLSENDCKVIEDFSKRLSNVNLSGFELPISLFSRSYYREDLVDRTLDLITTLESLLSEGPESIRYKLAFRAACLTAKEEDQWDTFCFTQKAYGWRSTVVHGKKKGLRKAQGEIGAGIEELESLTRKCLVLTCLFEMKHITLQSNTKVTMRNLDSIDEYILTTCLKKKVAKPLDSFHEVGKLWKFSRVL